MILTACNKNVSTAFFCRIKLLVNKKYYRQKTSEVSNYNLDVRKVKGK